MTRPMIAFLPCRAGSQRVKLKNTRPFAGRDGGLLAIKLEALAQAGFDRIVVSTNDPEVVRITEAFSPRSAIPISVDHRPDHLCSSEASTDSVIEYAAKLFDDVDLFWTHVTSPFVDAADYDAMIDSYRVALASGEHDSLMAVTPLRAFIWNDKGPVNYDRRVERWPRTQTLTPLYDVNSAAFVMGTPLMRALSDRVGDRPKLYSLAHDTAVDIDWEEDFARAEAMYLSRRTSSAAVEISKPATSHARG